MADQATYWNELRETPEGVARTQTADAKGHSMHKRMGVKRTVEQRYVDRTAVALEKVLRQRAVERGVTLGSVYSTVRPDDEPGFVSVAVYGLLREAT